MDEELLKYLAGMETRIMDRIDGRLDASEVRLKEYISAGMERVETSLLSEFWKWGRTSDLRTRQAMADVAAINERLLNVEDRISTLERKRGAA